MKFSNKSIFFITLKNAFCTQKDLPDLRSEYDYDYKYNYDCVAIKALKKREKNKGLSKP